MAKGEVTMIFDAQTAAFVQQIDMARQKLEASGDAARRMGEKVSSAGDSMIASTGNVVLSLFGVGSAISTVEGIWTGSIDRMKGKADELQKSIASLEDSLFKGGNVAALPAIRAQLEKMSAGIMTRETGEGIYMGIEEHFGKRLSDDQKMTAFGQAAKAVQAGASGQSATEFADIFGEFLPMNTGMGGDALAQRAYTVQQHGGLDEKALKILSRSKPADFDNTLNALLTITASHEKLKALQPLLDEASESTEDLEAQAKKEQGASRHRLSALAAIDPSDRLLQMLGHPELLKPEWKSAAANLQKNMQDFVGNEARSGTFRRQQIAYQTLVATDPAVGAAYEAQQAGIALDEIKHEGEAEALHNEAIYARMEQDLIRRGMDPTLAHGSVQSRKLADAAASSTKNMIAPYFASPARPDPRARILKEDESIHEALKRINQTNQQQLEATQQNNANAALKTNSDGQK